MIEVKVKPLSVNAAWKGRRFRSDKYNAYEWEVFLALPRSLDIPSTGPLKINLEFGFSSADADFDNPVKLFVDILQKRYNFNDKRIKRAVIDVVDVAKGDEYVAFSIEAHESNQ